MLRKCIYFNIKSSGLVQNETMLQKPFNLNRKEGNEGNKNPEKICCCATQHLSINEQFALHNISTVTIATIPLRKISEHQTCLLIFSSIFSEA